MNLLIVCRESSPFSIVKDAANYLNRSGTLPGVPPLEFIKVGYMAFVAARSNIGFTRGYFEAARSQGLSLPKDKVVSRILDNIAADPKQLTDLYREFKESDPRFAMYDLNPLFIHPIVRPWGQKKGVSMEQDRMVAPLPDLIAFRISMGIYYQMYNCHSETFSNYFGYVFETYVGQLVQESVSVEKVLSGDDIRRTYSSNQGKVPDWVVIDGTTAILIECKATHFTRAALTTGTEGAIDYSLKQVIKGFRQLHGFTEASKAKVPGLEVLHGCTTFKPILITLEPLYMINSEPFQNHIDERLATEESITNLPWLILAVEELERLQPHLAAGVGLDTVLDDLRGRPFNTVLEEIQSQTNLAYKDSFLYKKEQELYSQLGYRAET